MQKKKKEEFISSAEYQKCPDLFNEYVLKRCSYDKLVDLINSPDFEKYSYLFNSQVLAKSSIEKIEALIASDVFQKYQELFTPTVLAQSNPKRVKDILNSPEFRKHPELFTSVVLASTTIEDIRNLLKQDYWQDERFRHLLCPGILAKSRVMVKRIPKLIKLAEDHGIDRNLNSSYFMNSPEQNYAIIRYLEEKGKLENNPEPLFLNGKLHTYLSTSVTFLRKKYNIDINVLIAKFPYIETLEPENNSFENQTLKRSLSKK